MAGRDLAGIERVGTVKIHSGNYARYDIQGLDAIGGFVEVSGASGRFVFKRLERGSVVEEVTLSVSDIFDMLPRAIAALEKVAK